MDPRYLERDEIRVELDIRGLDSTNPQALAILNDYIEEELAGLRDLPTNLHQNFRSVNSEIAELSGKLNSIYISTGEISELSKCRARLLHLYGRIIRLVPHSQGNTQVAQLQEAIEVNLTNCSRMLSVRLGVDPEPSLGSTLEAEADRQAQALQDKGFDHLCGHNDCRP